MKKKFLSVALGAVMVSTLVAGCGANGDSSSSSSSSSKKSSSKEDGLKGTITFISNRTDLQDTKFEDYKKEFNKKYPDVKVEIETLKDYEGDIATRMQTTEYGDVLMLPNSVASKDFDTFFEPFGTKEELSEKYEEKYLSAKAKGDTVYGIPAMANATGVVYNKKVFKDAGIKDLPKTPDEFIEDLKLIKKNTDAIPYYTNYHDSWALGAWEDHAFGSVTGDADYHNNEIVSEKDPFSKGKSHYTVYKLLWDICHEKLTEDDPVTSDWESCKGMINEGKIGCMVLGSWAISQMKDAGKNADDIGYMAFPYNIDGKQYASSGADYCYAINKNSKNKEAAKAWVDFMLNDSGFALGEGCISVKKGDPLPENLSGLEGVELVVDNPATTENVDKFDNISNDSEVGLYTLDSEKQRIVDSAFGKTKESFDDIMNDWNKKWDKTLAKENK